MTRPTGLFSGLALLLAIVATLFGAMAVSPEHPKESGEAHEEHITDVAEHEGEETRDAPGFGERLAALAVSIFAVALVPFGIRTARSAELRDVVRFTAAVASAGAATIHFAVIDQHFAEGWLFGVFFVVVALAQLGWMLAVVGSPTRPVYLMGALGNALVALTWVVSRTTGLPFGPDANHPEPAGVADLASTAFELVIVIGTVLLLRGLVPPNSKGTRIVRPLIACAAIAITALALTSL